MKLIDILVKELPARGGWPEGAVKCCQSSVDSELYFRGADGKLVFKFRTPCRSIADERIKHGPHFYVTREQYEAALNAKPQLISTGKHSASLEQFINAGWTGSQLIEKGYFRHIKPGEEVEELPGLTCEVVPKPAVKHSAHSFLEKGVQHMKDRAEQRDSEDGERSMKACVDAFNAMFGHNLTETQGWQFMVLLKMARSRNKFNPDDYEDGAAYTGLAGEAHSNEQK